MDNLLRITEVLGALGRKRSGLYADIKDGLMTPPVKVGIRAVAWPESEVSAIQRLRAGGASELTIRSHVRALAGNRMTRQVEQQPPPIRQPAKRPSVAGENNPKANITDEQVDRVRRMREEGFTLGQISRLTLLPKSTVQMWCNGARRVLPTPTRADISEVAEAGKRVEGHTMTREDPQLKIRLPSELKARVEAAAEAGHRTVTAEVAARLHHSFEGGSASTAISGTGEMSYLIRCFEAFELLGWTEAAVEAKRRLKEAL